MNNPLGSVLLLYLGRTNIKQSAAKAFNFTAFFLLTSKRKSAVSCYDDCFFVFCFLTTGILINKNQDTINGTVKIVMFDPLYNGYFGAGGYSL